MYLIINFIKDFIREIKFAFQRAFRGFDDSAYWSLDFYLTKTIIPVLEFYRDEGSGHPVSLTEKQWKSKLNKMIKAFSLIKEENNRAEVLTKKELEAINKGLKEFADYYRNLWN